MRNFDFAPFYRSSVGFDRLFDLIDDATNGSRSDWPPYNIERKGADQYRIVMAVAGFGASEIELTQNGNSLLITGQRKSLQDNREILHQGIASRSFKQTFSLADHVKVISANLENGLLSVDLVREIPEQLKPRRIEIGTAAAAATLQDNQPKQINLDAERQTKAA